MSTAPARMNKRARERNEERRKRKGRKGRKRSEGKRYSSERKR